MSVNQAADIMGQSAAVRASGNFWLLSHSSRREMDGNEPRGLVEEAERAICRAGTRDAAARGRTAVNC